MAFNSHLTMRLVLFILAEIKEFFLKDEKKERWRPLHSVA